MTEPDSGLDSLLAFPSELQAAASELQVAASKPQAADSSLAYVDSSLVYADSSRAHAAPQLRPAWQFVVVGAIAATLCFVAVLLVWSRWSESPAAIATGGLRVETQPAGADVLINGDRRGVTPLTLSLSPGPYTVAVRLGGSERSVPVTVTAGSSVAHHFEMNIPVAPPALGGIAVTTRPAGARVLVDGQPRGVSPLTIGELPPGDHRVVVDNGGVNAARVVSVQAGGTATVFFSMAPAAEAGPVGGWLTVTSPFEVQVMEGTDVVGVSTTSRIMLAAGRHDVMIVNAGLEYALPARVDITPGQVTTVRIDPPVVSLNVNARPWADVSIDNTDAGQTPIANLQVTVGTHQLVFRHPQLGERRQTVVATAKGPNRVSVDLTK